MFFKEILQSYDLFLMTQQIAYKHFIVKAENIHKHTAGRKPVLIHF
jgi:hypothetical protein